MDENLSFNQRQYRLMLQMLNDYENEQMSLSSLIAGLEGLLGFLEGVSESWRQRFLQLWGVLEDIYSIRVDEGRSKLTDEETQVILQTISDLKDFIRSAS